MRWDGDVVKNRFQVIRKLGQGGMGTVFEAFDQEKNLHVALKVIRHASPALLLRFKQEFRSVHSIHHRNLVHLSELHEEDGQLFITMELVRGIDFLTYACRTHDSIDVYSPTLYFSNIAHHPTVSPTRSTLQHSIKTSLSSGRVNESLLRPALIQVFEGVSALHSRGLIHRDLKPSNILVTDEGRVAILDFGLVSDTVSTGSMTGDNILGTALYMSPEQAQSKPVTPAADLYSIGVIIYESLTGRTPFIGVLSQVLLDKQTKTPISPETLNPQAPKDLSHLCMALLNIDPMKRPSSSEALELLTSAPSKPITLTGKFVGRKWELARLREFYTSSTKLASLVTIDGESGMGKTSLVNRFVTSISKSETRAYLGSCYEREIIPYKAFDSIVDAISRDLLRESDCLVSELLPTHSQLLERLFPVFGQISLISTAPRLRTEHLDSREARQLMFESFRELIVNFCKESRVMLIIDDFQWADDDSLQLLHSLLVHPAPSGLCVMLTVRTEGLKELPLESCLPNSVVQYRLTLSPLSNAESRALVRSMHRSEADLPLHDIVREGGGHPLFLSELANSASDYPKEGLSLDDLLLSRIGDLDTEARTVLEVLAVSQAPLTQRVACAASGLSPRVFETTVLRERVKHRVKMSGPRVTDTIELYHDRLGEVLRANLSGDRTSTLHANIASALEAIGDCDVFRLLRHLIEAGLSQRAATCARNAGNTALSAMAFDNAIGLYKQALELAENSLEDVYLELARALEGAGRGRESADMYLKTMSLTRSEVARECEIRAAENLLSSGHITRGLEVLSSALKKVGVVLPRTPAQSLKRLVWNRLKLKIRGYRIQTDQVSQTVDNSTVTNKLDLFNIVSFHLSMIDNIRAADFQLRGLLLALKIGEPKKVGEALWLEAAFCASQGGHALKTAREINNYVSDLARELNDDFLHFCSTAVEGLILSFSGDYYAAELALKEALENADSVFAPYPIRSRVTQFLIIMLFRQGKFSQAGELLDDYLRKSRLRGDIYVETTMVRFGSRLWLARDRPDKVHSELNRVSWPAIPGTFHMQHWYELEAEVNLALYEGTTENFIRNSLGKFSDMKRSLLLRVQNWRIYSRWAEARLYLASAPIMPENARELRRKAASLARKLLREEVVTYSRIFGLFVRAAIFYQEGDLDRAKIELASSIHLLGNCSMNFHLAGAQCRLEELNGGSHELEKSAARWFEGEEITAPRKLLRVILPGFSSR